MKVYVVATSPKEAATRAQGGTSQPLCSDCPPAGYPTNKTRCLPCPIREENECPMCADELDAGECYSCGYDLLGIGGGL